MRRYALLLVMVVGIFAICTALPAASASVPRPVATAKQTKQRAAVAVKKPPVQKETKKIVKKTAKKSATRPVKKSVAKPAARAKVPAASVSRPAAGATPSASTASRPGNNANPAADSLLKVRASVVINGSELTEAQLAAFESQYRMRPRPGRYWYDARSGLYGNEGGGSTGFLLPGHAFGTLAANASQGTSEVFFNGRALTAAEVAMVDGIIGMASPPGRYWLDAVGNVGLEGTDIPLVNLYMTAQGNGRSGGDNFWSTRFSAGNANADNSQGYVSVPGYGPVGYGF